MKIYSILTYAEFLKEAGLLKKCSIIDDTKAVENITYNSKEAQKGTLFACKGAAFSKKYLDEAVALGACCYLSEVEYEDVNASLLLVTDIRKAMSLVADIFYDKAYQKLKLIGITGTKGKSTTAYYIKYILDEYLQAQSKKPCAIVSSIDTFDGKIMEESHLTTPEAFMLHRHFDNASKSGIDFFVMEVSSQALKYDRVLGVSYDIGIFLNISQDHISPVEHSDFEDYICSKLKLFSQSKTAIINLDCDHSERIRKSAQKSQRLITFSTKNSSADYYCCDIKKENDSTVFIVKSSFFDKENPNRTAQQFALTMPGLFNVENALAAIAACMQYNIPLDIIKKGLSKARSSGRMESYTSPDNSIIAIVDYAHNKLSFEALYKSTLEEYKGKSIITVFGCPGGKAFNRRVELGKLSGKYSDKVYLTAEDPGYEEVHDISLDIQRNVLRGGNAECFLIDDRGEAIREAIKNAPKNSVILITGKGNETRQKIKDQYVPCKTDADYIKEAFEEALSTI